MRPRAFVDAALAEELKLERALATLRTDTKAVPLHYAPISGTLGEEPREIWPFLGLIAAAGADRQYGAGVVFHGHAHIGYPEATTHTGIPVFHVALPVLKKAGLSYRE